MIEEEYVGKETTIDFGRDLRMSQPWRSYPSDEIFTIVRIAKSGLYIVRDSKGNEHPIAKSHINYFKEIKMSKEPPIIGRIISYEIREIDHSIVTNTENISTKEKIEHIKNLFELEEDKTIMNKMIEELLNQDKDDI